MLTLNYLRFYIFILYVAALFVGVHLHEGLVIHKIEHETSGKNLRSQGFELRYGTIIQF